MRHDLLSSASVADNVGALSKYLEEGSKALRGKKTDFQKPTIKPITNFSMQTVIGRNVFLLSAGEKHSYIRWC